MNDVGFGRFVANKAKTLSTGEFRRESVDAEKLNRWYESKDKKDTLEWVSCDVKCDGVCINEDSKASFLPCPGEGAGYFRVKE